MLEVGNPVILIYCLSLVIREIFSQSLQLLKIVVIEERLCKLNYSISNLLHVNTPSCISPSWLAHCCLGLERVFIFIGSELSKTCCKPPAFAQVYRERFYQFVEFFIGLPVQSIGDVSHLVFASVEHSLNLLDCPSSSNLKFELEAIGGSSVGGNRGSADCPTSHRATHHCCSATHPRSEKLRFFFKNSIFRNQFNWFARFGFSSPLEGCTHKRQPEWESTGCSELCREEKSGTS